MAGILGLLMSGAGVIKDQYFNLTSLLLPGNGTNGAQNNTFLDSSTNNFTITRNGNTTQGTFSPFSQTGWGNYFTGSGSTYLTVPDSTSWVIDTDYTIEFWVYASSFPGQYNNIVAQRNSGGTAYWGLNYDTSLGWAFFWNNGAGETKITRNQNSPLNNWVHVAVTRSSGTGYIFLNGSQAGATFSFGAISDIASSLFIGAWPTGGDLLNGYISNLRLVKGRAVYTSNFLPPVAPLTRTTGGTNPPQGSECVLLTCQSNRFLDSNGVNTPASSPLTITTSGSPSVVAFSPFAPTAAYTTAAVGGSGYFDGTGDYLSLSGASLTPSGVNVTIDFWFYPTTTGTNLVLFQAGTDTTGDMQCLFDSSVGLRFQITGTSGSLNTNYQVNAWNYVVCVKSGTSFTVYVNNVAGNTATLTPNNTTSLSIGGRSTGSNMTGYISGFRFTTGAANTPSSIPTSPPTTSVPSGTVAALLNFTNAGITDATAKNDLETVGNAQISTSVSKFGGGSIYFDGNNDSLNGPSSTELDMGTGNWTVEGWINITTRTLNYPLIIGNNNGSFSAGAVAFTASNADLVTYNDRFNLAIFDLGVTKLIPATGTANATGTWYHFAVVRNGTNISIYRDGVSVASATVSASLTINWGKGGVRVGGNNWDGAQSYLNGYIDDLRLTKGLARYTANFTPPTAPYPVQ